MCVAIDLSFGFSCRSLLFGVEITMLPDSTVRDSKKASKKRRSADIGDTDGVPVKKTKKKPEKKIKKVY